MINTDEEINNMIKDKLEPFSSFTENDVLKIFNEINILIKPRKIINDYINFFDNACKIEYYIDEKHYTMIVDKKEK